MHDVFESPSTSREIGASPTRRQFLATTGAAILAASRRLAAEESSLPVIDCHAHLYGEDEQKYPPIEKPYRPPAGTGSISHLRKEVKANGVRSVVAVQTMTFYQWDNRFNSDLCRDNRDLLAGVCLLNPDDPGSPALLEKYVKEYNIRGLRFIPNRKSGLLDEPGNNALLASCERLGITACALISRNDRAPLEALAKRYPKLQIVIDHCLNLKAGPDYDAILGDMLALAQVPNLNAKLSYLVTGSAEEFPFRDMHQSCRQIIDAFTPERCIWGSDFPCELWCPKATYTQNLRVFTHELSLDDRTKRQILCETPKRLGFAAPG